MFQRSFWYGCEADDAMTQLAFGKVAGLRLNAVLGTDTGHCDVVDMLDVVPEAYEALDDGVITAEDFADFTFRNPMRFFLETNPSFFEGTVVEKYVPEVAQPAS